VIKPFLLYVHERLGAVGDLTQLLGSWNHLVAALPVCPGSHCCLVAEADKLTLGQEPTVQVPHSVLPLMEYKENYWLTNSQMVKYQSMLCENLCVWLEVVKTLNPATL
jgi:hypothetical protein